MQQKRTTQQQQQKKNFVILVILFLAIAICFSKRFDAIYFFDSVDA